MASICSTPGTQEKKSPHLATRVLAQGEYGAAHGFLEIIGEQAEGVVHRVVNVPAGRKVTPKPNLPDRVEGLTLHRLNKKVSTNSILLRKA